MNNRRRMMIKSAEVRYHKRLRKDIRFWFLVIRKATKTILWGLNNGCEWFWEQHKT